MQVNYMPLVRLFEGAKNQFIVPTFQRDYSWGTKHCEQLFRDILRAGSDANVKAHFIGSVVYIAADAGSASSSRWLLIDGQQRMTSLTLLFVALRERLRELGAVEQPGEFGASAAEVDDTYLLNRYATGEARFKLVLRRTDQASLGAIVGRTELAEQGAERIRENYAFFRSRVADVDVKTVLDGIKKLQCVDVSLVRGQDDPQMIFESLNSTGLDLTQADLIRNFILMRLPDADQDRVYTKHWLPMEKAFGSRERVEFDKFVRDFLTLKRRPPRPYRADELYATFREYFRDEHETAQRSVDAIAEELHAFAMYFASFALGQERVPALREAVDRLHLLTEVASPLLLVLFDAHRRLGAMSEAELVEAVELVESYVLRRTICKLPANNLFQVFSSLAARVSERDPLTSLKVALVRLSNRRRFPSDDEFRAELPKFELYGKRIDKYVLERLENQGKERVDTTNLTVEHVMPQNPRLAREWQAMLGDAWAETHKAWLPRLGNLTLTAYNPELSDRPFAEKKAMAGGFDASPLRLNKWMREANEWTAAQMHARGEALADSALSVWRRVVVDERVVKERELEEVRALATRRSVTEVEVAPRARPLFDAFRQRILSLGEGIVELPHAKSVTYRVYDFFVEVIPRVHYLHLLLNLEFAECKGADSANLAVDTSDYAFVVHAKESGGVLVRVEREADFDAALALVRAAYERVAE